MPLTLPAMHKGRLRVRLAETVGDLAAAQELRARVFRAGAAGASDADRFDAACRHLLVEEPRERRLLGCLRIMPLASGDRIHLSYSAQFYDLSALSSRKVRMLELGRLCCEPGLRDADVLRAVWCGLTRLVDGWGVELMFGCTSFRGTDPAPYGAAFALLRAHLAPRRWRPGVKAPRVHRFAGAGAGAAAPPAQTDRCRGLKAMPPLLRSYLGMGGRVSDHAVVDEEMNTLHVFTAVEVEAIPAARKRLLRAAAA